MLGWVVVAGVIVRFFTRARDRGRNRFWWVSIGVASYMAPYILVHNVIGVWISSTFGIRYDGETLYFALLFASIVVGLRQQRVRDAGDPGSTGHSPDLARLHEGFDGLPGRSSWHPEATTAR
jgi:uncharacterized membrane protein YhaH (DUF805 family)